MYDEYTLHRHRYIFATQFKCIFLKQIDIVDWFRPQDFSLSLICNKLVPSDIRIFSASSGEIKSPFVFFLFCEYNIHTFFLILSHVQKEFAYYVYLNF